MALSIGTNCGFVLTAPSTDPNAGGSLAHDTYTIVSKYTSPAGATKITKILWWCDQPTEEADWAAVLYAADGAVVPGEAGTRLYATSSQAKGTTTGWKEVTVDWSISGSTAYWLGIYLTNTATASRIDYASSGGAGVDARTAVAPDPYGGGALDDADGMYAIAAVYDTTGSSASSSPSSSASGSPSSSASSSPSSSASSSPSSSSSSSPSSSESMSPSMSASGSPSDSPSSSPSVSDSNSNSVSPTNSASGSPSSSESSSPSHSPSNSVSSSPSNTPSSSVSTSPSGDLVDFYNKIIPFMYEDETIRYDATNDQFIITGDEEIYKVYDDATYGYFLSEHED